MGLTFNFINQDYSTNYFLKNVKENINEICEIR